MLKPKKQITRKEIKKDPLLETIDSIESKFEENKKTIGNAAILVAVVLIGGYIFLNKQNQNKLESDSALGIAMVAYSNTDYENAKFQLESISSNFANTGSSNTSNYFLGKIAYINSDLVNSEIYLNNFLNRSDDEVLVCGAIKILADISMINKNAEKALMILDKAKSYKLSNLLLFDLRIVKASVMIAQGALKDALNILDDINNQKNIPKHLKQRLEELYGMI